MAGGARSVGRACVDREGAGVDAALDGVHVERIVADAGSFGEKVRRQGRAVGEDRFCGLRAGGAGAGGGCLADVVGCDAGYDAGYDARRDRGIGLAIFAHIHFKSIFLPVVAARGALRMRGRSGWTKLASNSPGMHDVTRANKGAR